MRSRVSVWLGWRYRTADHNGIRKLMIRAAIIGIALGVAVSIIGLSAMNGFETELRQRVLDLVPHGEIEAVHGPLKNWGQVAERLAATPGVIATAPYIQQVALLEHQAKLKGIQVRGIDQTLEAKVTALPHFINPTYWLAFQAGNKQLIVGQGVADQLGIQPGDWVTLLLPQTYALHEPLSKLHQPQRIRLQVMHVVALGSQLDQSLALLPLQDLQTYLALGQNVTGIALKVDPIFDAQRITRQAAQQAGLAVTARSWIDQYGALHQDIQMVRAMIYLAMFFVMAIACFNITSTLMITLRERQRDIAILRTLGANDGLIGSIFLWYGLFTGLTGILIGIGCGLLVASHLTLLVRGLERLFNFPLLPAQIYFIDFLPSEIHGQQIIIISVVAMTLTLLASGYPIYQARHSDPVALLNQR